MSFVRGFFVGYLAKATHFPLWRMVQALGGRGIVFISGVGALASSCLSAPFWMTAALMPGAEALKEGVSQAGEQVREAAETGKQLVAVPGVIQELQHAWDEFRGAKPSKLTTSQMSQVCVFAGVVFAGLLVWRRRRPQSAWRRYWYLR